MKKQSIFIKVMVLLIVMMSMLSMTACGEQANIPQSENIEDAESENNIPDESEEATIPDAEAVEEALPEPPVEESEEIVPELNQDVLSEFGLTFEQISEKHGDVINRDEGQGGIFYEFSTGFGQYSFNENNQCMNIDAVKASDILLELSSDFTVDEIASTYSMTYEGAYNLGGPLDESNPYEDRVAFSLEKDHSYMITIVTFETGGQLTTESPVNIFAMDLQI